MDTGEYKMKKQLGVSPKGTKEEYEELFDKANVRFKVIKK